MLHEHWRDRVGQRWLHTAHTHDGRNIDSTVVVAASSTTGTSINSCFEATGIVLLPTMIPVSSWPDFLIHPNNSRSQR